jgi:uncharacterized delta-60 repeat protein
MKNVLRCILITCLLQMVAYAQPELDMSFNSSGKRYFPGLYALPRQMLIQPDNKIVMVLGECSVSAGPQRPFCLFRLNEDGSPDSTFSNNGNFYLSGIPSVAYGAAIQKDGKLVVVGSNNNSLLMTRLNSDGSFDPSFGSGGTVITDIAPGDVENAMRVAVQPDGKIVTAGYSQHVGGTGSTFQQFVARYTPNGTLDSSFGTAGVVKKVVGDTTITSSLALQADGKIVAGGYVRMGTVSRFLLVRYNSDGSTDTTWDGDGVVTGLPSTNAQSIAIQLDGCVLALDGKNLLYRYNADGSPDMSFDGDGSRPALDTGSAYDVMVSASGKITVTGGTNTGSYFIYRFNVAKYRPDGSSDTSFSDNGYFDLDIARNDNLAMFVAMDSQGRTVVAGLTGGGSTMQPLSSPNFSAARLLPPSSVGPVGLSGRITRPDGTPLGSAVLILQGGNTYMTTISSPFGYYSFANVPSGQAYTISPGSKKALFDDRNLFLDGEVNGFNIISDPVADAGRTIGPIPVKGQIK